MYLLKVCVKLLQLYLKKNDTNSITTTDVTYIKYIMSIFRAICAVRNRFVTAFKRSVKNQRVYRRK